MEIHNPPKVQKFPISIPIRVWVKNNMPCVELRRCVQLCADRNTDINNDLVKTIVSSAFHNIPLTIVPTFSDRVRAISSLIDKGILYYDTEKEQYFYTF